MGSGRWHGPQWCSMPSSLSFLGLEVLLWLYDTSPLPLSLVMKIVSWASVSSTGSSQGDCVWPVTPNTAILNVIPCIFQAGYCAQPWAMCPCAVSLFSGR